MEVGFTHGEVAVLAAHRGVSPALIVGDRLPDDQERLLQEGWRSLLARGLARFDGDQPELDTGVAEFAEPAVRPRAVANYTRIVGETPSLSTFFIGDETALSAAPISDEVTMFSSVDMGSMARAIVGELRSEPDVAGAFRLEVADLDGGGTLVLSWVHLPGSIISVVDGEESTTMSLDEFSTVLEQFIEPVDETGAGRGEVRF